jgi:glycosyltransferase involved in cell wall biosynthesis
MTKISVITPLHEPGNRFVAEAYESLCRQTVTDWEWVIVENRDGTAPGGARNDPRVRVVKSSTNGVGALKREACKTAKGDFIVELDCDDILVETALARVSEAFDRDADFVYSDFAEFQDGSWGKPADYPYAPRYGWSHYEVEHNGHKLTAMRAPLATAHNVRLVDWTPNHVRAWRANSYWRAGGHDASMVVGDDHDLVVRMLLDGAKFVRIEECLYLYRVHGKNTTSTKNAAIRDATMGVYNKNVWKLAEKWTKDRKLALVDLCGGVGVPPEYTPIDRILPTSVSGIECDLDRRWDMADSSVGLLRAHDAVEHLRDPVHTMNEAYRVLAPGGWLMVDVPSTNGLGAFSDPTHVSFWNKLSFAYYTDPSVSKYLHAYRGKFQVSRIIEWFPTTWHRENNVPYVEAHLISCKDGFRAMGEYLWTDNGSID